MEHSKSQHHLKKGKNERTVYPDPEFVLQITKGKVRKKEAQVSYKEKQREKFFNQFSEDLSARQNEKLMKENRLQLRLLSDEALQLEKRFTEYQKDVSTFGEIASDYEERASSIKTTNQELLDDIEDKKMKLEILKNDVSSKEALLEKYCSYKSFLDKLSEESGNEIGSLESLIMVFSGLEDHCITLMQSNQKLQKELKIKNHASALSNKESEHRLINIQIPVNNLSSATEKLHSKVEKRKKSIQQVEQANNAIDITLKKLVHRVNTVYRSCIIDSAIQVSTEMMLGEIENALYALLDTMKTFPAEKLVSAARARRKEELRREQEIKLEALKKR